MRTQLYRQFDKDGNLLYIGISLNAMARLAQHADAAHWYAEVASMKIETFSTREEAEKAERDAVRQENPKHNKNRFSEKKKSLRQRIADLSDESRAELTRQVVAFCPVYDVRNAARVLGVRPADLRDLMERGIIGHVRMPKPKRKLGYEDMLTGWHLIDYLEKVAA